MNIKVFVLASADGPYLSLPSMFRSFDVSSLVLNKKKPQIPIDIVDNKVNQANISALFDNDEKLTFTINSENNGDYFSLDMLSREKKIDITNELINSLENLPYIQYKIIK